MVLQRVCKGFQIGGPYPSRLYFGRKFPFHSRGTDVSRPNMVLRFWGVCCSQEVKVNELLAEPVTTELKGVQLGIGYVEASSCLWYLRALSWFWVYRPLSPTQGLGLGDLSSGSTQQSCQSKMLRQQDGPHYCDARYRVFL